MIVFLLRASEMRSVNLPSKIYGHYPVGIHLPHGGTEVLLTVAACGDHWEIHVDPDVVQNADEINRTVLYPEQKIEIQRKNNEWMILYCAKIDKAFAQFRYFAVEDGRYIKIGTSPDCEIRYHNPHLDSYTMSIRARGERYYIDNREPSPDYQIYKGYVDGVMVSRQMVAGIGSVLHLLGLKILFGPGFIAVNMAGTSVDVDLPEYRVPEVNLLTENQRLMLVESEQALFSSAPRAYHHEKRQVIKVEAPPQVQKENDLPWAVMVGPALTMSMGSLFSSMMTVSNMLSSGGSLKSALPSLVMSLTMVTGMTVWPTLSRKIQKKQREEQAALTENDYMNYLQWLVAEIDRLAQQQINFTNQNNPSLEECIGTIYQMLPSLWERSEKHEDFLDVMIGRGSLPLNVEFSYPERSFSTQITESARAMYSIMEKDYAVQNVPITIPFKNSGVVGVVGQRTDVLDFIRALVIELTTLHNYQDLRMVFIYDETEQAAWSFAKWVPHVWDHYADFRCVASNPDEMKQLNDYLLTKAHKKAASAEDKTHYIIICASKALAERSDIITKLYDPDFCTNMTVLALYNKKNHLPKDCRFVVDLQNSQRAAILDYDDVTGNIQYCSSYVSCADDPEELFIRMSNIHLGGADKLTSLPTSYTMTEMCKVGRMEQIDLPERWKNSSPVETLKGQIGIDSNGYPIYLDVHEKAHGPHGLIAGMTGSGKSEFIISYIASMAMSYSPEDVAFVLIDFKGGGMADVFRDLPHTAGLITNLDGNELKRSFMAIESELQKRQRLFKTISEQKKISNIDIYKYQNLRRTDPTLKPLPHLILISDEFAELKQQHRDFMEQLVRIARIGRSLGVHLILATQKPDGVVDDQIKSNIRFRVCLKVQDKNDSRTMIGKPDAADILYAGRFYFLVGNDELFEYGQSPWSGATYIPSDSLIRNIGTEVTVIDKQGRTVLREAMQQKRKANETAPEKQIDALVNYISTVAKSMSVAAEKLWLHPLSGPKETESTAKVDVDHSVQPYVLNPVIGVYDDLENQCHLPLTVPFTRGGNTLLYATSGSGELEFINAMLFYLLENHAREELNLYLVDYDAGTLSAFERAPHVKAFANALGVGDAIGILNEVSDILKERKQTLKEYGGDFQNYIQNSGMTIPNILLVVHNYQNLLETNTEVRSIITSLARQGTQYGIYIFMTGTTGSSIPYSMLPLFHNVYTMQQNSEDQYREILGKTGGIVPANYKGRGLTRVNGTVCEFQTTIIFPESENIFQEIRRFCEELRGDEEEIIPEPQNKGYRWSDLIQNGYSIRPDALPVALDAETNEVRTISIFDEVATMVVYDEPEYRYCRGFLKLLRNSGASLNYMGVDDQMMHLDGWDAIKPVQFAKEISELWEEMLQRAKLGQDALAKGEAIPDFPRIVYVVDSVSTVMEWMDDDSRKNLIALISGLSPGYHIHFVMLDKADKVGSLLGGAYLKRAVPFRQGLVMSNDPTAQMLYASAEEQKADNRHQMFTAGKSVAVRIIELGEGDAL